MENKYFNVFNNLEKECISTENITSLAITIQDALNHGESDKSVYVGAINILTELLIDHKNRLNNFVDKGFDLMQSEVDKGDSMKS